MNPFDLEAYVLKELLPELALPQPSDPITIDELADSPLMLSISDAVSPNEFVTRGEADMTAQQVDQWLELQELLPFTSHMCAWCAQSMPQTSHTGSPVCCSSTCAVWYSYTYNETAWAPLKFMLRMVEDDENRP